MGSGTKSSWWDDDDDAGSDGKVAYVGSVLVCNVGIIGGDGGARRKIKCSKGVLDGTLRPSGRGSGD